MTTADELQKLNDLLNNGVITQEEFDIQKKKILAGSKQPPPPTAAPQAHQPPPMPSTYLVQAILVTLLCCLPFGIVAIVKAAGVSSAYAAGNYNLAVANSKSAATWVNVSAIVGFLGGVIWFFFYGGLAMIGMGSM